MSPSLDLQVLDDPAGACAAMLLGPILGGGNVVLTGGHTPGKAYGELARALRAAGRDVSSATIWFSDERCVAPSDELSNFRLVEETLLRPLAGLASPEVVRMEGERGPDEAAELYEQALLAADALPFDLVLLGLGSDGHIASLFPDQATLSERSHSVVGVDQAGLEPHVPRVTLTLPVLTGARQVVVLVTGESKAEAVAAAFGPRARPEPHVPGSLLAPLAQELTVVLDSAAAAGL